MKGAEKQEEQILTPRSLPNLLCKMTIKLLFQNFLGRKRSAAPDTTTTGRNSQKLAQY